ncbi:uncharacterized protein LOC135370720 isoform X2 [Ornithodoros turicata]|uniref:uncharacterized protein LOC135370720 isoform X2 n=1 Tax=Ornithodoros turicata TaxID=34597 RepID=UPI0031396ED7
MAENEVAKAITKEPSVMEQEIGLNLLAKLKTVKLIRVKDFCHWVYSVQDTRNKDLFSVYNEDEAGLCPTCVFGPGSAPFTAYMKQSDRLNRLPMMVFERPLRLQSGLKGLFCCCLGQEMKIDAPLEEELPLFQKIIMCWVPPSPFMTPKESPALKVIGPTLPQYCPCATRPSILKVQTMTGTLVGEIIIEGKRADCISISFPENLDILIKGICHRLRNF